MNEHHEHLADHPINAPASPPRRQRRDASQWRALVEQQRESGLSVRAFCQQHALDTMSFYAWRRRLRDQDSQAAETSKHFVRLQPRVHDDEGRVQVRFACGASLQCSAAHLPELVRLLKANRSETLSC